MSNLSLLAESVFTIFPAIYNKDTNTVLLQVKHILMKNLTQSILLLIYTLDEYIFVKDFQDQLYQEYLYNIAIEEHYKLAPECYF